MSAVTTFGVAELRRVLVTFRDLLHAHRSAIDRINVYPIADSDTGTNMARTVDAVVEATDGAGSDLRSLSETIVHSSLMGARGNSGVILSQVLRGLATTLGAVPSIGPDTMTQALRAASRCADQAMADPVEGTILTVVRASADGAAAATGPDLGSVVGAARDAAAQALAATTDLLPELRAAGVVDAGGAGYLLLLDALAHVVDGTALPEPADEAPRHGEPSVDDDSASRYEVMFLCELADDRVDDLKRRWAGLGDSIAVAGSQGLWTCHVHTNDVGAAIEAALDVDGRPRQIRVTDLFEEVAGEHPSRDTAMFPGRPTPLPIEPVDPDEPAGPDEPEPIAPDEPAVLGVD